MKKNTKNLFIISCLVAFFLLVLFSTTSFAAEINVEFSDPNLKTQETSIPGFLSNLYKFGIGIGGVLAFGMIVVGGIYYITSGAIQKKTEGKEIILGALWGLALLLGAFLIMQTINPRLIELESPGKGILKEVSFKTCRQQTSLPECKKNKETGQYEQSEINFETGECQCRFIFPKETCPIDIERFNVTREDAPEYKWTKELRTLPEKNTTLSWGEIPPVSDDPGCPTFVRILPGTTPYFITGVDSDEGDEKFIIDLKKQPQIHPQISYPLPNGGADYIGVMFPLSIGETPEKALCVLRQVIYTTNEYGGITNINNLLGANLCQEFSESLENEIELQIKKPSTSQGDCEIGKEACAPQKLNASCPLFEEEGDLDDASIICVMESSEDVTTKSGSDFCKNEAGKPSNERHPFSLGLFQINVIANMSDIRKIAEKNRVPETFIKACEGLYKNVHSCKTTPCKLSGGTKTGYDCTFPDGQLSKSNWNLCRQLLSIPQINIEIACKLYEDKGRDLSKPWKTSYDKCDL